MEYRTNFIFSFCQKDLACNTAFKITLQHKLNFTIESMKKNYILDSKIQNSVYDPNSRINCYNLEKLGFKFLKMSKITQHSN